MKKNIKIWLKLTSYSFTRAVSSKFTFILFTIAKILRFLFFLIFLLLLLSKTKTLAGYTSLQAIFFLLTFNMIDTLAQLFFREVYRFRSEIISGNFDLVLVKPINPLLKVLFGGADGIDFIILIPLIGGIVYLGLKIGVNSPIQVILYILLCLNAFLIATSFHIFVLALGVLTTEVDNTIMMYRDIARMGTIPIDIYKEPLRSVLTFAIPVGIMMTFPVKAFLGLLSWPMIFIAFFLSALFLWSSLSLWKYSLKNYSSASS